MKKKNDLEAELLSAESPLQLIKTDYFVRVMLELDSSFVYIYLHWIEGVKALRGQLNATSKLLSETLERKTQEIDDLVESYNALLAVHHISLSYS